MIHLLSPGMNLDGLLYIFIAVMFGPAVLLVIIGLLIKNKKASKILYILAAVYLLISLGSCGVVLL